MKSLLVVMLLVLAGLSADAASPPNPTPGAIWTWMGQTNGPEWAAGALTPQAFGCIGDGVADDTACVQAAINGAVAAGAPLRFLSTKLYNITSTLNLTQPVDLEGPFRYGIWAVNQSTGTGPAKCPWGLVTHNTGIDMIRASAVTGTIRGICIDMTGDQNVSATAGAAINLTPPDASHYSSGWHIELNTILQPFDGVAAYGNGVINACCGIGTAADGIVISRNTIVSPGGVGISLGKNNAATAGGPGTVGFTVSDNNIVCKTAASHANGIGIAVYEGGMWYDGTQNGPEGCNIGTAIIPGVISGNVQTVSFSGDGVFGDQSGSYNLLVRPNGGVIEPLYLSGKEPWANSSAPGKASVLIDCTNAAACEEFTITNLTANITGANGIGLDIEGGANGPYDVTVANSMFCAQSTVSTGTIGLKLNAGSGATGRWIVTGNRIGTGCFGGSVQAATGISLTINSGSIAKGSVTITGNDISAVATPIVYAPSVNDSVIIKNNMGVDNVAPNVVSAATITLPVNPIVYISGGATVATINGMWQGRQVTLVYLGVTFGLSGGNLCNSLPAVHAATLTWAPGTTCWTVAGN